jgi:2-dehydro-3-deoxygluconokinase
VAATLASGGVDLSAVAWTDAGRLGTCYVELAAAPRATTVTYDREGSTMSLAEPSVLDWKVVCDATLFHVSGITFGISAQGSALAERAVQEARARGCQVSLDVNYRSRLWSPSRAASVMRRLVGKVDLVICKKDDARLLFGLEGSTCDVAARLQEGLRVPGVVVTAGPRPVCACLGGEQWECAPQAVEIVDRIGAGDAFAAGVLWGYLEGSLARGLERGVAMAALKMTLKGDLFRLDRATVEAALHRLDVDVNR